MKKVLVPLADGFEEIETVSIIDVLRRAGLNVVIAGLKPGELSGARQIRLLPDTTLDKVKDEDFDVVILPGGQPGVDHLRGDARVLEILRRMNQKKKLIGAICAAPLVLRDAGLTQGIQLTSYPSIQSELSASRYLTSRVVVDGNVVTSRGPGTAIEFALKLAELILGKEKAEELGETLLAPTDK
jgi:4-methyl-5(b-hydroxyethyl)-thiazole monophosphate biosynthesis